MVWWWYRSWLWFHISRNELKDGRVVLFEWWQSYANRKCISSARDSIWLDLSIFYTYCIIFIGSLLIVFLKVCRLLCHVVFLLSNIYFFTSFVVFFLTVNMKYLNKPLFSLSPGTQFVRTTMHCCDTQPFFCVCDVLLPYNVPMNCSPHCNCLQENPLEVLIGSQLLETCENSRLMVFFHRNSMTQGEIHKVRT